MGSIRRRTLAQALGLAALGAASLVAYIWLFAGLTWLSQATPTPASWTVPLPAWFTVSYPRPAVTLSALVYAQTKTAVGYTLTITVLFAGYLAASVVARGRPSLLVGIVVGLFAAAFQAAAVLAPWSLSGDIYSYISYGRIYAVYGANPYLSVPADYPQDIFYPAVYWKFVPSFYGPAWTLLSGLLARIGGEDVGLTVLLFRVTAGASALAATGLAYLGLRRYDPERALAGTVLIGWSPFVVVECGLSMHNDALMAALMVGALLLARARSTALAVGVLLLAGLVKVTALALLPLLGIYALRHAGRWRERALVVVRSALVGALVVAAGVLPVWAGPATLAVRTLGSGADRYVNSLDEVALGELRVAFGTSREDLEIPLTFAGWWFGTHSPTVLMSGRDGTGDTLAEVTAWQDALVLAPERNGWIRVFLPSTRQIGYLSTSALGPIDPPAYAATDPEIVRLTRGPLGTPELQAANWWIRTVGWAVFGIAFVLALVFGTGSFAALIRGWLLVCLALFYVTLTWFWPWYVLAALLPAALLPRSAITRFVVVLAWGMLLIYPLLGFIDTSAWWLYSYRSLAIFGLPILVWLADTVLRLIGRGVRWCIRVARRAPFSGSPLAGRSASSG
ncbi:MAG: hypothetical protein IT305_21330 [Chloroflexi bacterium]|nr:hypothetical protein [Chloroflexota bacterium]